MDKNKSKSFNGLPLKRISDLKVLKMDDGSSNENSIKAKTIRIINWLNENYDFRYNIIIEEREFKAKKDDSWSFFNDRAYNNIKTEMQLANINFSEQNYKSIVHSDKVSEEYNPFKDYIYSLPRWDGKTDYLKQFTDQIELEKGVSRAYLESFFRLWFVGLVMNLVNDEVSQKYVNQLCFILHGEQGRFKTTFLNSLIPTEFVSKYTYTGEFNPHDKDHKLMLAKKILINLDEMSVLTKTSIESLKSAISLSDVSLRKAYAKADSHLKRRSSFCGSINRENFLTDLTGNRRFLIVTVKNIKLLENFDLDLMYAQAFALYKNGERWWLTHEEIKELEPYNERYRQRSSIEEILMRYFRPPDELEVTNNNVDYMTAAMINEWLSDKDRVFKLNFNDTNTKQLGMILKSLGFLKKNKRIKGYKDPVSVWVVKKVDSFMGNNIFEGEEDEILF